MTAQHAQLTALSEITWSSGHPFNGYVLLIMALPSADGASWTRVNLRDTRPRLRVPTRVKVPIREGVLDAATRVWFTTALVPTQVKYSVFWYDDTDRLIAIGDALFTITASPHFLTETLLPDPTASITSPDPEDVPSSGITTLIFGAPDREDLVGTKNGINTAFTATRSASVVMVLWNGQVLDEGIGYSRIGVNYVMTTAPDSGDSLEVVLW